MRYCNYCGLENWDCDCEASWKEDKKYCHDCLEYVIVAQGRCGVCDKRIGSQGKKVGVSVRFKNQERDFMEYCGGGN